ncbi:MinD-like ATPase involved in chromosome partitioning or flagellar assembly [Catenuloplanes nepalensis]|uniref:MinD-like ATPase involved in chromosome partitioning or flagellar assembly n=1 Tax=Catenuloplanes nepalensis TaxID=587533 RepID=A0ABT9N534_9ACTN|nr:chromosome partitioning protein [Catenuloplanes nepalensis]MDP9798366.1 MinD-like ATPase involved in chromosome partitioning or flagellar assembly [Catenuloplanes nepalensis]
MSDPAPAVPTPPVPPLPGPPTLPGPPPTIPPGPDPRVQGRVAVPGPHQSGPNQAYPGPQTSGPNPVHPGPQYPGPGPVPQYPVPQQQYPGPQYPPPGPHQPGPHQQPYPGPQQPGPHQQYPMHQPPVHQQRPAHQQGPMHAPPPMVHQQHQPQYPPVHQQGAIPPVPPGPGPVPGPFPGPNALPMPQHPGPVPPGPEPTPPPFGPPPPMPGPVPEVTSAPPLNAGDGEQPHLQGGTARPDFPRPPTLDRPPYPGPNQPPIPDPNQGQPPWQQQVAYHQQGTAYPPVPFPPQEGQPPAPDTGWEPDLSAPSPTADDFARRRTMKPADPVAQMGVRAGLRHATFGLLSLAPGRREQEIKKDIDMVRRNFGGLRQVTIVNPKGGAGKTIAVLLLAMTFGQRRGGYVLAWDNNETQGTLGMRAQQDFHARTVRDMLRDLVSFQGASGRVGDLSQYVRAQGEGMFDVLASDESATAGEILTADAFAEIRDVVSRFYKLIFVDTGNNVRAQNWQAAIDATDQLVVTMSARNDSAETAARMLDHLEQTGRQRLVRQAVTIVSSPSAKRDLDTDAIFRHFAARTRVVVSAPYERSVDTGEPIRYGTLSSATRDAWLKIAAAVAEGL